jgi:hypothetical protein
MSSLTLEPPVLESVELQALRLRVRELEILNEKISNVNMQLVQQNDILGTNIKNVENCNNILSLFAWCVSQVAVAYTDKNRWLTGVDMERRRQSGLISPDTEIKVTNHTAWEHFQEDGLKKAFDSKFKKPDGSRDFDKLIRSFDSFIEEQVV